MKRDEENKCKGMGYGQSCNREREPDSEFCICHLKDKGKDAKRFWAEVDKILNDTDTEPFDFVEFFFIPQVGKTTIDFRNKTFSKEVNFGGATFSKEVNFVDATFSEFTSFLFATFSKEVHFNGATFSQEVRFGNASFKSANFWETKFYENAEFWMTTFKSANFRNATFYKDAKFEQANVKFERTIFKRKAQFQKSIFEIPSSFKGAEFNKLYFNDASFDDKLDFSGVFIESHSKFIKTVFPSEAEANFKYCNFEKPERISFNGVDLRWTSFKNTDLSRIYFANCEWARIYRRFDSIQSIFGKEKPRPGLYDELLLRKKQNPSDYDYSSVETLYRQLKYNYEEKRNYPDAGEFYIGEMEMRRKGKLFSILTLYRAISMYGEHYWLPLLWIFLFVMVFGAVSLLSGFEYNNKTMYYSLAWNNPFSNSTFRDFIHSCILVFRAFTLQSGGISPIKGSLFSEFIQAILKPIGVVLFALWALALRRRFRR